MIGRVWRAWVALTDRREAPDVLAVIRIGVGLVLLYDFAQVGRLGLVHALLLPPEAGMVGPAPLDPPLWTRLFGATPAAADGLYALLCLTAATTAAGALSRASALALMLLSAQWAAMLPEGDRAIDMLLRNALLVLACSGCGATWSVDARIATGRWSGDGHLVPAWPRYLLLLQVVVMYFTAGVQKYGQHWWPWGGFTALYVILHDWSYARYAMPWLDQPPFRFGTGLATAVTMAWQWTYPAVLLPYVAPDTRIGAWFVRFRLHWLWIAVGAIFHLLIAATMELGIFPFGMLAVYPAFVHPDELGALARWLRSRARSPRTSAG